MLLLQPKKNPFDGPVKIERGWFEINGGGVLKLSAKKGGLTKKIYFLCEKTLFFEVKRGGNGLGKMIPGNDRSEPPKKRQEQRAKERNGKGVRRIILGPP
eukprot:TRINITY_DN2944_c6_g1_i1.p1 TRINITY_DN2944_c6_g1~~TRINITY_DN2944_c6_g1_i1.p1  ORF type:complete len:100 (-),score=0.57 TRINITY_DN2944_c6_g1_i1:53-352(-)